MKLDDLIGLFIFFVFFILPIFSRAFRKNTPSKPAPSKRSAAPGTGKSATPSTTASTGRTSQQLEVPPSDDEAFAKRLEEARRRVEAALEQRQAEPQRRSVTPKQDAEAERGMFTSKPAPSASSSTAQASTPPLQRGMFAPDAATKSVIPQAPSIQSKRAAPIKASQEDRGIAQPLRVQRLPQNRGGTISKHLVSTEPDAVTRGIIWHQILSTPRARRYIRRAPSRRQ